MTYTRAKLIIWNDGAYTKAEVREAVVFILASFKARREDIHQAALLT